jgi:hypothetical protein
MEELSQGLKEPSQPGVQVCICSMLLSDDGDLTFTWSESQNFNLASFNPASSPLSTQWGDLYSQVRRTNLALANLDRVVGDDVKKARLKGEPFFCGPLLTMNCFGFMGQNKLVPMAAFR